jgi:ring-1,2-phenylacetyl-CoA epoxidase subunit PaaA
VLRGEGQCNAQRVEHRKAAHEGGAWVREAAVVHAAKKAAGTTVAQRRDRTALQHSA